VVFPIQTAKEITGNIAFNDYPYIHFVSFVLYFSSCSLCSGYLVDYSAREVTAGANMLSSKAMLHT
jgi:hypothetical protein